MEVYEKVVECWLICFLESSKFWPTWHGAKRGTHAWPQALNCCYEWV